MSEYQYYEFLAVDRPLDDAQQAEVRALSTRARITATRFINEYHWGEFRGDPRRLVERYFDAHLYLANWGTRRVMFRLPQSLLALDSAEEYCAGEYPPGPRSADGRGFAASAAPSTSGTTTASGVRWPSCSTLPPNATGDTGAGPCPRRASLTRFGPRSSFRHGWHWSQWTSSAGLPVVSCSSQSTKRTPLTVRS